VTVDGPPLSLGERVRVRDRPVLVILREASSEKRLGMNKYTFEIRHLIVAF